MEKNMYLGCHLKDIHGKHYFIERLDGEIWVTAYEMERPILASEQVYGGINLDWEEEEDVGITF
jgi:hypothetical protein